MIFRSGRPNLKINSSQCKSGPVQAMDGGFRRSVVITSNFFASCLDFAGSIIIWRNLGTEVNVYVFLNCDFCGAMKHGQNEAESGTLNPRLDSIMHTTP